MSSCSPTRRDFLRLAAACGLGAELFSPAEFLASGWFGRSLSDLVKHAPVARYWTSTTVANSQCAACHGSTKVAPHAHARAVVKCQLCAHGCTIEDGKRGRCGARINAGGQLKSLVYGRPIAEHVDPIEKKPFFHFLPGSNAYSLATSGCPLRCRFCQNWQISQAGPEDYEVGFTLPGAIVGRAAAQRTPVIAFTYNEPTVFTEYLTDIARAAKKSGIRSVLVSCGFMLEAPLREMIGVLDAIKIDLKGFSPKFYSEVAGGELRAVLRSIVQIAKSGRHLEVVNLVVPTLNDSPAMLAHLVKWFADSLGPDVPLHFTRFHPDYQLQNLPPTPVATLDRARELAMKAGLHYVYVGNVPGHAGNNTYCPSCGRVCIERNAFFVTRNGLENGKCGACGTRIAGVWS